MKHRRPVLAHLTTTDITLELLLGPQLTAFAEAGYEVIALSAPGPYVDRIEARGVRFIPMRHASRAGASARDLRAAKEAYDTFRGVRPDIVHTHNPKPGVYGRIAARAARVPVVVNTVHGLYAQADDPLPRRLAVYALERLAATCSQAELVQNPEDVETLARLGVPRARLHQLGNGIDLDRFDPHRLAPKRCAALRAEMGAGPGDVVCGAVGRLVWEKGYRELFEAAARLRRTRPDLRIVVVGERDAEKQDALSQAEISRAEQEGGVCFLGHRDDVDELYGAFDMYVLASHREGFPRSAMEAAAMGLPVVATNIRGCRQVVDPGRTGVLVPSHDVDALTAAIDELAGDPQHRAALACAARARALHEFDQHRIIDTTLGVYDQLLGRARSCS
jgi:glycosyltransferase involved in cell wall biosynthesis